MKVVVDFDLCEENGLCADVGPEVFYFDADDQLRVRAANVTAEHADSIREAVRLCPRAAITFET
jgi:ferredoxin